MRCIILTFLFSYTSIAFAQLAKPLSSDLAGAQKIDINTAYSFKESPVGFGNIKEFKPGNSPTIFKEERNTIWLVIDIPYNGDLTFEIAPHDNNDDYDWMLFNYESDLAENIGDDKGKPLRSNNSRNDKNIDGKTGLKEGFTNPYEIPGPGSSFSRPLHVLKGQKLAIIIDNIYPNGSGFKFISRLQPVFSSTGKIEGVVKSKLNGLPVFADIVLEDDSTGVLIGQTKTDSITGTYSLIVPLHRQINITATNPKYLFATTDVQVDSTKIAREDFLLDSQLSGSKLILFNIHFSPNKDEILSSSKPDLERLTNFMKQESRWIVKIIGHTNNNVFAETSFLQKLSFDRALSVKNYLLKNGIEESRMSCAGQGGKNPIINTKDPVKGMRNLRVEIVLVKSN